VKFLTGQVAVVAGATRGAGRGIACMLGEAGATVYCTGRSTRSRPSPIGRPETIEETADMVTARGGAGYWQQVDHTQPEQVGALFERVRREQNGQLDLLVNDLSGDWNLAPDTPLGRRNNPQWKPFWQRSLDKGLRTQRDGVESHLITAYYAAQLMAASGRGLIVEMTDGNHLGYNDCGVYYSLSKVSAVVLAHLMAEELREHNVAVVSLTPGDMLSEVRLEREVAPGQGWATIRQQPGLAIAESCFYTGRAVVALASDPNILYRTGHALSTGVLAREYGFVDEDGTQPVAYQGEGQFESNRNFAVH
jgi:NAD(P)-dependent dehydrogenase (short-subunit alcohol dehydrogenase family)